MFVLDSKSVIGKNRRWSKEQKIYIDLIEVSGRPPTHAHNLDKTMSGQSKNNLHLAC